MFNKIPLELIKEILIQLSYVGLDNILQTNRYFSNLRILIPHHEVID